MALTLLAAVALLTGCPSPTQDGNRPLPPLAVDREHTNPAAAELAAENAEKERKTVPRPVETLYACDFENAETNKLPADFLVLDGAFVVREENGARFLELPGAPLDTFGLLFGPTCTNSVTLCARVFGTNHGRREPVFGVGLGGAGGLRLMVAPGKRLIELWRGDDSVARAAYAWEPGKWTWMRLRLKLLGPEEWIAEGKAWREGTPEPPVGQIVYREKSTLPPGRAAVWGSPISGTPIRYDDFKLTAP